MPTVEEHGFRPAIGTSYNDLWTRDHCYVLWHDTARSPAADRQQFISHRIATRSTNIDPTGGGYGTTFPNFIVDRIDANNTLVWQNPGASHFPFMDGIAFVVLALWSDWKVTGSTATYLANKAGIDACLAALPRDGNGCVYSEPATPSVDYGFTDGILKTGAVAYGTALICWAYKMLADLTGENGSGPYSTLRATAQAGLATLRKASGWYAGSSVNNAAVDDVWATALIVAEDLALTQADRLASAQTIADAYNAGTITMQGWVRHLPVGQYWAGSSVAVGTYQNGGYWLTPLWDCYRAVQLVDAASATEWKNVALNKLNDQIAAEGSVGVTTAPYEWFYRSTVSTPKGYTASGALVRRFV
jgi:hypothetical protein